jgi:hypothetical protein
MKHSRSYLIALVAVIVGLAVTVPAQAAPQKRGGTSDSGLSYELTKSATQAQPSRAPTLGRGLSDFGLPFEYTVPETTRASADSVAAGSIVATADNAFSWQDASIGAGAALLMVSVLGIILVGIRHTRRNVALP